MKKIGIILNPSAKINSRKTAVVLDAISGIFGDKALVRTTRSKNELPRVIKEFTGEGIRILLISGGDGTLCNVISDYIKISGEEELPVVVPLMGGTINMIGADAGLRDNQLTLCKKIKDRVSGNGSIAVTERGLLRIKDDKLPEPVYGFSWIDGLLYRFLLDYYNQGAGIQVASIMTVKTILTLLSNADHELFRNFPSAVHIDGKALPHEGHVLIIASSLKKFVFGFDMYAEDTIPGKSFNAIYLREDYIKKSRHKLPLGLYKSLKSDKEGNFINKSVESLRVERNRGYIIDGEIFKNDDPTNVTIEPGPTLNIFSFQGEKEVNI
ncbi:MAG: diacylglycerol kinase family protein [Deltaproteobacteria bacterium]